MNHNIKMAFILYKSGINELNKKGNKNSELYPQLLYNMTFVCTNLYEKKFLFERIQKEYPAWYEKNEVYFYYKRVLKKLKKLRK